MSYNTKNYAAHGGGEWVIGGKLTILEGAEVTGLPEGAKAENIPDSTATDVAGLVTDFNALLAALKAAGIMEPDPEEDPEEDEGDEENGGDDSGGEEN